MRKEEYEFDKYFERIIKIIKNFNINPSDIIELHHIFPNFSNFTIPLPKNWHAFITNIQNSVSKEDRKNEKIFLLLSIAAILLFIAILLFWFVHKLRKENEEFSQNLSKENRT
ncbi:MAG: hypothetical protein KC550_06370 [Nanoarchaeota archaeon]|nr:hypothetical protein [Nanoarchaeota archaeon]